uniref:Uncharacterized protein n=1 Tax=Phytophthora ramorum TaxID=164328 RepID=H3HAV9_PHYRM
GAKALLEVLRLQIIAAKTPPTVDPRTRQPLYPPLPEYTRYVTNVNLKGNEVSPSVLQEISHYIDVLRREDKRLEIRAALKRIDRNSDGSIDEEEFKGVLKLLTAATPTKKEIRAFMQQHTLSTDSTQNVTNLENIAPVAPLEMMNVMAKPPPVPSVPEEDEEVEEQIDSLVVDITKDGKERYVLKLTHSEFRRGLAVKDFPAELPFRTLVALLLPENGLSDLALFSDCRFPFVLVLDLSRNKLSKLADDDLTAFPRLEVLNLADNQLKTISGLTKMFKLRALGIGHNSIRTLSLNKVLAHLDLDGNPVVETDEPQPAPVKKKKKPALVDPSVVREQQRRASELSAPKHGPVDKNLMQQAQKRKSRVDFHGAMTVAERLQLARDMTQRRPTASVGLSARSRASKPNGSKEAEFLHDLAVSDFLNHAEEEFSTALTALNVLLSMSEKEQGDRKKLADYRASLDALDILNEYESHELFTKAQGHPEHELQAQCTEWFTKLGVVKKCMRQLLEKLEVHAPGSGAHRISQTIGSGVDDSKVPHGHASGDNDLDFLLESNDSVFDVEETGKEEEDTPTVHAVVNTSVVELQNEAVVSDPVLFVVTTDITMDIQMNVPGLVGSNHNADDTQWTGDVVEDNHNGMVASGSVEDEGVSEVYCETGEPVEVYDSETLGRTASDEVEDEATNISTPADAAAIHDEDYDWLADSSELEAENTEADSFKQEMDAVSEDETNGEAGQEEQTEASQAYDWSNIEAPIEEGAEASEEVFDGETYENEESNDTVEEQGDYNGDEEVATEETEVADSQFDLREGVDADDEEAETFGDWEKGFDPNSNHYFWFNHSTGDSSWTPPEGWPYEVDEPFSTEEGVDTGEEQQEREYEASAAEGQEYDEPATEGQDYEADGQYYDEGATEGQYYDESAVEEGTAEGQYYEEGAVEDRYYEEGAAEGESYNEGATEDQEYEEASAEGQEFEESEAEEQQYEATTEGQWYDETATENQEYATEDQTYEVAEDEEHQVEQAGEESPRRSEVSDFEFDDSDLPGF